ncbi:unnamed protein product, partial [Polarella glacialis]
MQAPSLLELCVQKLAQSLIKYGPKRVRFARLSVLPRRALEALLDILVAKNALNDNVLPHALTCQTETLHLEGASQLRRCVLNTIGRSCPNLRMLDVRACQQVDNRIVRDVLQYCEHLEILRIDGCTRISDSAFAPALWKAPLAGLLGLKELSVGKCGQVTAEGLMGYVLKGAPYLRTLGLSYSRHIITDEVASELLFQFGLHAVDFSFCTQITDVPFQALPVMLGRSPGQPRSMLRELRLASTNIGDAAVEGMAQRVPQLEVFDAGFVMKLTDLGAVALVQSCTMLRVLCVCNTGITDATFKAIMRCRHLERLDASWCLRATSHALHILSDPDAEHRPPLRELVLDHLGAMSLDLGLDSLGPLPPPASPGLLPHLWDSMSVRASISGSSSPLIAQWLPMRLPPEVPSLLLPPAAQPLLSSVSEGACSPLVEDGSLFKASCESGGAFGLPDSAMVRAKPAPNALPLASEGPPPSLKMLITSYGRTVEQLLLDGVRGTADAATLKAIASSCPVLEQLALTLPFAARDADDTLEAGLCEVGAECGRLALLRLDASARSHRAVVNALAPPSFGQLRSLTLWCSAKGGGLQDSELETILSGRTSLQSIVLRNCEGLSEGLFPRWCNRGDPHEKALVSQQLDQALLSVLGGRSPDRSEAPEMQRRRQHSRHPAALALRS